MKASRVGVLVPLEYATYICQRCGIVARYNGTRKKPEFCRDCKSIFIAEARRERDNERKRRGRAASEDRGIDGPAGGE